MESKRIAIGKLTPNKGQIEGLPANPRQWTQTDIDRIARSLRETPELFEMRPCIVYPHGDKFVILGGNLRYTGAKANKDKDVPCIVMPEDTPVEKLREIVVKDNGSFGQWDYDMLANEWDDLPLADWGVPAWDTEKETPPATATEDDFNEDTDNVETRCKRGDVWVLGDHRLMCGDSTDADCLAKLMNGHKADMVFTDPPYGNGESGKYGRGQLGIRTIMGDENLDTFKGAISVSGAEQLIYFLQWRTLAESLAFVVEMGMEINTVAVWDKKNAGLNGGGGIAEQWEAIVFAGNIKYRKFGGNVFSVAREQHKREDSPHPHQKPLVLLSDILAFVEGGKFIYDPFGGSGSTLITAEQLGRRCYTMELDPHYCDVILARWEKLTGKTAERAEN